MKAFIVLALVALASADVSHVVRGQQNGPDHDAVITSQTNNMDIHQYENSFSSSNGIQAQETGQLQNAGREDESLAVQGSVQYTDPNGTPVQFSYVADANGYQPQGSHIPTPHPIPEAIQRSLDYIAAHPQPPETQQQQKRF